MKEMLPSSRRKFSALVSCLLLLFVFSVYAQERIVDSLETVLKAHPQEDTVRLDIFDEITWEISNINPQKGISFSEQAIQLALKINDLRRLALAYSNKGLNYSSLGEEPKALQMYEKALQTHTKVGNKKGVAVSYGRMASSYCNLSQFNKALEYHGKALPLFQELHLDDRIAATYNNIGVVYLYLADYPAALEQYLEALAIYQKQPDKIAVGNPLLNIGIIYYKMGNYPKSLEYLRQSEKIFLEAEQWAALANVYGSFSNAYSRMGDHPASLSYNLKALALEEKLGMRKDVAERQVNIGINYLDLKDFEKAWEYCQKSLKVLEAEGPATSLVCALSQAGDILVQAPVEALKKTGLPLSQRFEKADRFYTRALQLADSIGDIESRMEILLNLSEMHEKQMGYKNALKTFKLHSGLKDSLLSDEKRQEVTRSEMKYEQEKKEAVLKAEHDKQTALAKADLQRESLLKNLSLAGFLVLLVAAGLVFYLYKRRRDLEDLNKKTTLENQLLDTEMKALRAQMNPHFIFNSLNSISRYLLQHDIHSADKYLAKFAQLMRLILENSEHREVMLKDDLRALELYMELESSRLANKFSFSIYVDPSIDPENTLIPPLLLQPFVENSIWHGFSGKEGKGEITIYFKKKDSMLQCSVQDNGVGRKHAMPKKEFVNSQKPIGLKITKARIDLLNQIQRTKAEFRTIDLEEGLRIELTLPFQPVY